MTMTNVVNAHEQCHTITEILEYPTHPHRSESPEYKRNHHTLVYEEKRPCFVCELIGLPPIAGEYLETHHYLVEWAEWENADAEKIRRLFDNGVFDFYGYSEKLRGKPVESPDDIRNLVVLCPLHHRGKGVGIHETSGPMWNSQLVAKSGVEVLKGALDRASAKSE
jgi:hypothetical protein